MENKNHSRKPSACEQRLRDLDLLGKKIATFVVDRSEEDFTDASPIALAIIFEAVAEALTTKAAVLRGGRVRQ